MIQTMPKHKMQETARLLLQGWEGEEIARILIGSDEGAGLGQEFRIAPALFDEKRVALGSWFLQCGVEDCVNAGAVFTGSWPAACRGVTLGIGGHFGAHTSSPCGFSRAKGSWRRKKAELTLRLRSGCCAEGRNRESVAGSR